MVGEMWLKFCSLHSLGIEDSVGTQMCWEEFGGMQGRATRGFCKGGRTLPNLLSIPSLVTLGEPRRQLGSGVDLYYLSSVKWLCQ